jgi:hypothetical protein
VRCRKHGHSTNLKTTPSRSLTVHANKTMIFISRLPRAADPIAVPRPRKCPPSLCHQRRGHPYRATRGSSSPVPWHSGVFWVAPPRAVVTLWEAERRCLGVAISGGQRLDAKGHGLSLLCLLLSAARPVEMRCAGAPMFCHVMLCFCWACGGV